jgi:hypothetical protein
MPTTSQIINWDPRYLSISRNHIQIQEYMNVINNTSNKKKNHQKIPKFASFGNLLGQKIQVSRS